MNRTIRTYIISLLMLAPVALQAQATFFTPAEQQQISIPTAGLFSRSNAFTINFATLRGGEYSFPLPVGKATLQGGQALEIVTSKGDAVKSMFAGTVRLSRKTPQYGHTVVIRHDNGLETVYANNAENLVKVGQRVKAGQTVAIVGGSGAKYACLFAILVNGGWINPTTIIDPSSHRLRRQTIQCRQAGNRVELTVVKSERDGKTSGGGRASGLTLDPDEVKEDPFAHGSSFKLDLSAMSKSCWAYPLPGSHVISPYGGKRNHSGVDLKTCPNDKIVAAFDGVVMRSGPFSGYGNYIVIRHAYGFTTCYSHQSKNLVKVGQRVKAGEVIGLTGRTGRATTEHLHFEVRYKGRCVNPALVFDHGRRCLHSKTLTLTPGSVR